MVNYNFYVTKKILANGEKWSDIMRDSVASLTDKGACSARNWFKYSAVRDAWKEMEKHFCSETVVALISELDRVVEDEYLHEVEDEEINRVVVKFTNKYNPSETVMVEYVCCGDFLESELVYSKEQD